MRCNTFTTGFCASFRRPHPPSSCSAPTGQRLDWQHQERVIHRPAPRLPRQPLRPRPYVLGQRVGWMVDSWGRAYVAIALLLLLLLSLLNPTPASRNHHPNCCTAHAGQAAGSGSFWRRHPRRHASTRTAPSTGYTPTGGSTTPGAHRAPTVSNPVRPPRVVTAPVVVKLARLVRCTFFWGGCRATYAVPHASYADLFFCGVVVVVVVTQTDSPVAAWHARFKVEEELRVATASNDARRIARAEQALEGKWLARRFKCDRWS